MRRLGRLLTSTALCLVLLGGCDGKTPARPDVTPTPTPTPASAGCEVRAGGGTGPVPDPNGPFFHFMALARSTDGVQLAAPREVLDHASVPDGVRTTDGRVLVYYVNGATNAVWVARVEGTDSVTPIGPISLNGTESPLGVVDPDATLLPDGRIRLTYLSGFGSPGGGDTRAMCMADSTDGVSFTVVGAALRLTDSNTTDPSLLRLDEGSWLMAMSRGQQTVMARSADGLSFVAYDMLTFGGVPELASTTAGTVRLYVCSGGITSYVSTDRGGSWSREATIVAPGALGRTIICDPSWVAGANLFLFKTAN